MRLKFFASLIICFTQISCIHAQLAGGNGGTGGTGGTGGIGSTAPRLTITKASLVDGTVGSAYSDTLTAVNGVLPLSWSIAFGSLPPGLSLNSVTGVISGTPTAIGNYVFTVLVFDSSTPTAKSATKDIGISITCPAVTISSTSPLPPGTTSSPYSFQFQANGGLLPLSWTGTGLPTGLSLSLAGLLSGTPTVSGQNTLSISLADSCTPTAQTVTQPFSLTINGVVTITTTSPLSAGTLGQVYTTSLSASGGTTPYVWTLASGTLPGGLALSSGGVISGTPTTAQSSTFTVRVADNLGLTNTAQLTLVISCPPVSIASTSPLPTGTQNAPYRFQFQSNGGVAPIAWTTANPLPNGLTLTSAGLLSGTPTASGTTTFTVTATDSCSTPQTDSQSFTIVIGNALTITSATPLPDGTVGQPYNTQLVAQGGVPPYTWSTPAGPLPAGASDLLDYWLMSSPLAQSFHMGGGSNPRYSVLNAGLAMAIKSSGGMPQDGRWYDGDFLYFGTTDNGDAADQQACINAGFPGGCFLDPSAYKLALNLRPFSPRYFVLGGPDVTINDPAPNMGVSTTNCGADNHTPRDLGNVAMVIHDAGSGTNWGGDVGNCHTVVFNYYRSLTTLTPPYQSGSRERYYGCVPFGVFNYDSADWNGTSYGPPFQFQNLNNLKVAGGAPTPNFACKIPTPPVNAGLPPGTLLTSSTSLNLGVSTGIISGTPAQSGISSFTVQVEDSVGTIAQKDFSLTVACPAFSIGSTSPIPNATQGRAYTFQFQSVGGIAPITWTESGTLPAGMTFTNAGVLSGTPTNFGSFLFTATATDSCQPLGSARQKTFTLTVSPNSGALTISTATPLPAGTQGTPYSAQLQATGGTTPYTWAVSAGVLPTGLVLNSVTGVISGTPTALASASVTFRVTDAIATTTTKVLSISITCPTLVLVSTPPLPNGVQNSPYSFQFQATGGIAPYSWTRTGGTFPTGLTFPTSGLLSGTPTASGSFSPVVQVADSCSTPQTASNTFVLTISAAVVPIVITTTSPLPAGTVGVAYSTTLAATGGTPPYFWSITSGALPGGLALNAATGAITGTPTTAQTTTPTVQVTDNVGATTTTVFSITIACPAFSVSSTSPLPTATQSQPYSFQFTSSGGVAPIVWTSGAWPTGLTLSSGGLLSGTPTGSGTSTVNVTATDSCSTPQVVGPTGYSLTINAATVPLQITTATTLPAGTINKPYSATLAATGGTPPYGSWTVTSGALPTGLSLSSAGIISGTPTVLQTTTPTIRVADNVAATASKAFSITINPASTADNRDCNANETPNFTSPTDGPATLFQKCVRTAIADTPAGGPTKTVCASGCDFTTIQAAANAASAGWIIQVKAGSGGTQNVLTGAAVSGLHGTATNWIWIETDQTASLPAEGTRITPAWVGKATIPGRPTYTQPATPGIYLPKIRGGNNTFTITNSSFIRVIGLEFTSTAGTNISAVTAGTTSDHIIFDRVLCHGGDSPTWQDKDSVARCFSWTGMTYSAIVDSYLPDTHCVVGGSCTDSQVILAGGNSASPEGPFKFVNNFLETAAEPILFGGGGANAATTIPCDIEIRRNHFFKPLFWKVNDPSYFGTNMEVKNNLELKTGCRVLVEGNIFDTTWQGQADQKAFQFLMGNKNQSSAFGGTASSNGAGAITKVSGAFAFNSSQVSPLCAIPLHCNFKYNGIVYPTNTVIDGTHIIVGPNRTTGLLPPSSASASFLAFQPGQNPNATVHDVTARFNRYMHSGNGYEIFVTPSDGGDVGKGEYNISIHDEVWDDVDGAKWCSYPTIANCGFAWSLALGQISNDTPAPNNLHDVTIKHLTGIVRDSFTSFPAGSIGPGIAFIHQSAPATSISNLKIYDNILPAGLILDQPGICSGGRIQPATTSFNCVTSVGGVGPSSGCFDHNALATTTATTGPVSNTSNNPPYPSTSTNCPFTVTGNPLAASYNAMQFTNLNGGIGGNYQLLVTSPYHNAASDGKDMGADVNAVNQATAGVQ